MKRGSEERRMVGAAKSGDEDARALLCARYLPRVRAYLTKRGLSRDDLEDSIQEVFLRMLEAFARQSVGNEQFTAWVFAVARHVATDCIRRRVRERQVESLGPLPQTSEPGPVDALGDAARRQAVHLAVQRLPDTYGRPLKLLQEGLTPDHIAARLGVTRNAICIRLFRARQMLFNLLHDGH